MPASLLIFCFALAFLILVLRYKYEWRSAFLLSSILWGALVTLFTEGLSIFRLLSFSSLIIAWGGVGVFLLGVGFYFRIFNEFGFKFRIEVSWFEFALLAYLFSLVLVIGIIAWVSPPNTWDSMTYHMSRVMHWMQNKSVSFYPTHIIRQLYLSPWGEYAILQFQILSGSDRFANFIQWFSMVGSMVGVSLLARELKADVRGQIFVAVVCATIPMGILQASSTQTDYIVAFWLVSFVYFVLLFRTTPNWLNAAGVGLTLGLAILTKATAYVYAFPFLVWLGLSLLRRRSWKAILRVLLAALAAFIINMGHFARNYDLFGNPFGVNGEKPFVITNEVFSMPAAISNVVRNVGLHIGTPFSQVNSAFEDSIYALHEIIGFSANDPRTTWFGSEFHVEFVYLHEDLTGNIIHLLLIFFACLTCFVGGLEKQKMFYAVSVVVTFFFFSLYLKWQPWHSRLHLPFFILFSPFVGLVLSRIKNHLTGNAVIVLLMIASIPWVFFNASRPLLGSESAIAKSPRVEKNFMNPWQNKGIFETTRNEKYFYNNSKLVDPYLTVVEQISKSGCANVGLMIGGDDWEYPLWVLLREKLGDEFYFTHVNVTNISRQTSLSSSLTMQPHMCAVLAVNGEMPATLYVGNTNYSLTWYASTIPLIRLFLEQH